LQQKSHLKIIVDQGDRQDSLKKIMKINWKLHYTYVYIDLNLNVSYLDVSLIERSF